MWYEQTRTERWSDRPEHSGGSRFRDDRNSADHSQRSNMIGYDDQDYSRQPNRSAKDPCRKVTEKELLDYLEDNVGVGGGEEDDFKVNYTDGPSTQPCLPVQSPILKIGGNGPGSGHFGACLVPTDEQSLSRFVSDGYNDNAPNMFSIRIHQGGKFRRYPGIMYVNGHVDIFDMVDIDLFTIVALNMMVVQLGYIGESKPLFYNYLRPLTSLDEGLYALACEEDVRCLATLVRIFKLIEVYIEHGVTILDSYIRPPRFRATIEEITDEPGSIEPIEHISEKILLLTWHDSSEPTKEPICFGDVAGSGVESSGLSYDESFGVDDLDLNLNELVNLNVSQIETQSELPMSEEPDVCRSQEPIIA
ncbi:hypothetical protein Tco_0464926 [Tanacetum coccineum]